MVTSIRIGMYEVGRHFVMTRLQCEFLDESLVTQHQGLRTTRGEPGIICTTYWWVVGNKGIYIYIYIYVYMGGCQNYGPFLGALNIRCRIITGTQKGIIILTSTHIYIYIYIYIECGDDRGILFYRKLGLYRDNGKRNGNYYSVLGIYRDSGKWKLL